MLFLGGLFVLLAGLCMLIWPKTIYQFIESWKSNSATQPSKLYIFSLRFGGSICTLVGLAGVIYFFAV